MANKTTDFQRNMFYDIYKTTLGAILSRNEFAFGTGKEDAILDAIKIAKASVDLLADTNGLKEPSIIIEDFYKEWETIKKSLE